MALYNDLSYKLNRDANGDIGTVVDFKAFTQEIKTMILMPRNNPDQGIFGKDLTDGDFGTIIHSLLFEPITDDTASIIEAEIEDVISAYSSRLILKEIIVNPKPDENGYDVEIIFDNKNIDITEPVLIPLRRL